MRGRHCECALAYQPRRSTHRETAVRQRLAPRTARHINNQGKHTTQPPRAFTITPNKQPTLNYRQRRTMGRPTRPKDVNESTHGSTRTRTHGFGPMQTGDPHSREIRRRVDPRSMDLYPWIADRLTSQCTSICSVPHVAHLSVLRMPKCSNLIEL